MHAWIIHYRSCFCKRTSIPRNSNGAESSFYRKLCMDVTVSDFCKTPCDWLTSLGALLQATTVIAFQIYFILHIPDLKTPFPIGSYVMKQATGSQLQDKTENCTSETIEYIRHTAWFDLQWKRTRVDYIRTNNTFGYWYTIHHTTQRACINRIKDKRRSFPLRLISFQTCDCNTLALILPIHGHSSRWSVAS